MRPVLYMHVCALTDVVHVYTYVHVLYMCVQTCALRVPVYTHCVHVHVCCRYYLVQQAKEARTVGILVGTLGAADYLGMIQRIKAVIKAAGKKVCAVSSMMWCPRSCTVQSERVSE